MNTLRVTASGSSMATPARGGSCAGAVLCAVDVAIVFSAFLISYHLRFCEAWHVFPTVDAGAYLKGAGLLTAIWVTLIWRQDGYARGFRGAGAPAIRVKTLCITALTAIGVLMAVSFLYRDLLLSRQVYLTTTVLALGVMVIARHAVRAVERDFAASGIGVRRIAVLGDDEASRAFAVRLREESPAYQIADASAIGPALDLERIEALHRAEPLDKIVLSLPQLDRSSPREESMPHLIELLNFCEAEDISLYAISELLQRRRQRARGRKPQRRAVDSVSRRSGSPRIPSRQARARCDDRDRRLGRRDAALGGDLRRDSLLESRLDVLSPRTRRAPWRVVRDVQVPLDAQRRGRGVRRPRRRR